MKKTPINTEREAREHPFMRTWVMGGNPDAILAQEAQGQHSLVGSDTLPTHIRRHGDYDAKAILEAAGVKFLGPVKGDEMFQYVELPQGWKRVATDESRWSKLVDDKGRERASIFYKAAFYDRSAHLTLTHRFCLSFDHRRLEENGVGVMAVIDDGKVIHTTKPISGKGKKSYEVNDEAQKLAVRWLSKKYPDWQNPGAYWD